MSSLIQAARLLLLLLLPLRVESICIIHRELPPPLLLLLLALHTYARARSHCNNELLRYAAIDYGLHAETFGVINAMRWRYSCGSYGAWELDPGI